MKFGIIYCGYNTEAYVEKSLDAFLNFKSDRHELIVSAVSVPFKEYGEQNLFVDRTIPIIRKKKEERNSLVSHATFPLFIREHEARNLAVKGLNQKVDAVWLVDSDEIYTAEQIEKIADWVEENSDTVWFKLSLKNYIFDKKHWLEEPFQPPRIFRTQANGFMFHQFHWDNDATYKDKAGRDVSFNDIKEVLTLGPEEVWIDHYSWMNDEIGKRKVAYQMAHFGHCAYRWCDKKKGLELNDLYFEKTGEPKPNIVTK